MLKQYLNRGGYTIVEGLVVIAVTAAVFLSASLLFRGRQLQVQFDQSIKDFEATMRDIMNDVSTGYYPTSGLDCDISTGVPVLGGYLQSSGVVVFLSNFDGGNASDAAFQAQNVRTYGLKYTAAGGKLGLTATQAEDLIRDIQDDNPSGDGYIGDGQGVTVCIDDQPREAALTIGNSSGESTILKIGDDPLCA